MYLPKLTEAFYATKSKKKPFCSKLSVTYPQEKSSILQFSSKFCCCQRSELSEKLTFKKVSGNLYTFLHTCTYILCCPAVWHFSFQKKKKKFFSALQTFFLKIKLQLYAAFFHHIISVIHTMAAPENIKILRITWHLSTEYPVFLEHKSTATTL